MFQNDISNEGAQFEKLKLFSLEDDFFPLKDSYNKMFTNKTIKIGDWSLIRFGVVDQDTPDNEDNDFIENQAGISITIGDVTIDDKKFTLLGCQNSDYKSVKYALCRDLFYVRDDIKDELVSFCEALYNLNPSLIEELVSTSSSMLYANSSDEIKKALNEFDTKGKEFWEKYNLSSPNNLNIPHHFWLLSALAMQAYDEGKGEAKLWLYKFNNDTEPYYFYEGRDSCPVSEYGKGVFMICSNVDNSEGEFTFKDGLFSLSDMEEKFETLEEFFGYISDNSYVIGLTSEER